MLGETTMSEKCSAKTKSGADCRAPAVVGTNLCAFHSDPTRAAELGRMGGRKNRHYVETEEVTMAPPSTPQEVKVELAQAFADVRAGKLHPRIAMTMTALAGALLKSMEITDQEQRIARLEGQGEGRLTASPELHSVADGKPS
jgi:hypothetical protein